MRSLLLFTLLSASFSLFANSDCEGTIAKREKITAEAQSLASLANYSLEEINKNHQELRKEESAYQNEGSFYSPQEKSDMDGKFLSRNFRLNHDRQVLESLVKEIWIKLDMVDRLDTEIEKKCQQE